MSPTDEALSWTQRRRRLSFFVLGSRARAAAAAAETNPAPRSPQACVGLPDDGGASASGGLRVQVHTRRGAADVISTTAAIVQLWLRNSSCSLTGATSNQTNKPSGVWETLCLAPCLQPSTEAFDLPAGGSFVRLLSCLEAWETRGGSYGRPRALCDIKGWAFF